MNHNELCCRFCDAKLTRTFIDLGCTPLANSYLSEEQLQEEEPRYPLHVRLCDDCLLLQVEAVVTPDEIFSEYAYFSSYSKSWVEHARRFSIAARNRLGLRSTSLVVEIASNDGYLLRHFVAAGIPVLGFEPAGNVACDADRNGVRTEVQFFSREVAQRLAERSLQADLLVANNVLAHVPDLNDFVAGLALALKAGGTLTIEVPHLLRMIEGTQFDTIYHEHFWYFSLLSMERVLSVHDLYVFDVEELPTHGGSIRVWATHADRPMTPSRRQVAVRQAEHRAGLDRLETYAGFDGKVQRCRRSVVDFLAETTAAGKSVVAYGAAAKGNTLLNFCGISNADIDYVVDRNPYKQHRYLPGTHLPIRAPDQVRKSRPDFLLILPWNLREEIMTEMAFIRAWGGQFVTPVPTIAIHS